MELMGNIIINTFSAFILLVIHVYSVHLDDTEIMQNKLYLTMLWVTISMLFFDILGRLDGYPDTILPILNHVGNFVLFLLTPIVPSLWLLFVYNFIFNPNKQNRKLILFVVILNMIHAIILILSLHYGWIYTINAENIYHRGPLYMISPLYLILLLAITTVMILNNRHRIDTLHYYTLLIFPVPPLFCILMQTLFYGISLQINGVVLSLLIILLFILNQNMNIDYLTGVNNRKRLEIYMRKKVETSTEKRTFSAIMIDLNNFKYINDTFGHLMGDEALKTATKLMKSCLKPHDFIARYGGDEFCIVLNTSDKEQLDAMVKKIERHVRRFNKIGNLPYSLGLSMGYDVYDIHFHKGSEDFQKHIDKLMYQHKQGQLHINI